MGKVSITFYLLRESAYHLVSDAKYITGTRDTKFLLSVKPHSFLKLGSAIGNASSLRVRSVHFRLPDFLHV